MYALVQTAKLNDVGPQAWLAEVLVKFADTPHKKLADPPKPSAKKPPKRGLRPSFCETHSASAL